MTETIKFNSDWNNNDQFETYGDEKQEMEYVSPTDVKKESIEKIKSMDLRPKLFERGHKILSITNNKNTLA